MFEPEHRRWRYTQHSTCQDISNDPFTPVRQLFPGTNFCEPVNADFLLLYQSLPVTYNINNSVGLHHCLLPWVYLPLLGSHTNIKSPSLELQQMYTIDDSKNIQRTQRPINTKNLLTQNATYMSTSHATYVMY